MWDIIIVGGGAAGCSAAIYAARFGLRTLLLDRNAGDGQLAQAAEIENYPGFRSIGGAELAERFRQQAAQSGAVLLATAIRSLQLEGPVKRLETDHITLEARTVILATGAQPRRLGLPEEGQLQGRGVSYCAACDAPLYRGKIVGVVGGGNSAVTEAYHLSRLCREVHLIFRRPELRASKSEIERLQARSNVRFHAATEITALLGTERLNGIRLANEQEVALDGLFVAIGREPESRLFRPQLACGPGGGILTDGDMATALRGVFAAGDVREKAVRQVITAAADGAIAACAAERYIKSVSQSD